MSTNTKGAHVDRVCEILKYVRATGGATKGELIEQQLVSRNVVNLWLRRLVDNGMLLQERDVEKRAYIYRLAPAWIGRP
jgi:predicted transcriptional regulator